MNFLSREAQTIATQRVRIEELEETLRQMRENLAPAMLFPIEWKLTVTQARMLAAFYRAPNGFLSHEQLFAAMQSKAEEADNLLKVQVAKLRQKAEPLGINILKRWGVGYEMPAESRAVIGAAIK